MIALALLAAAASWSAPQPVAEGKLLNQPQAAFTGAGEPLVSTGGGTVLTYASRSTATFDIVPHGLRVRFGAGHARDVAPGRNVLRFAAATDARGNMVVAYVRYERSRRTVEVVERPAGGTFGRPRVIAGRLDPTTVGAGVGRNGERFVAYERAGRVEVRRRERGHLWTAPQMLAAAAHAHTQIDVAAGADGTAAVAWLGQLLTEGGDNGPATYRLAIRDARGHAFHTTRVLETFPERLPQGAGIDAAIASDGSGVVGWTGREAGRFVATAAGLRGAPQTLSPADAVLGGVAAGPGGTAVAVWAPPLDTPSPQVFAAVRPAGASAFAPPETVSPAYREVVGPVVALDPRSGRALAAWLARTGQSTQAVLFSLRSSA